VADLGAERRPDDADQHQGRARHQDRLRQHRAARAEHTLLLVQKFGRKVMEYFADVFSGKFSAPNLSERAKHLTVSTASPKSPTSRNWRRSCGRGSDGALIGATYKRDTC
jgi:hypothetical protein